jgi:hypothetical protein
MIQFSIPYLVFVFLCALMELIKVMVGSHYIDIQFTQAQIEGK